MRVDGRHFSGGLHCISECMLRKSYLNTQDHLKPLSSITASTWNSILNVIQWLPRCEHEFTSLYNWEPTTLFWGLLGSCVRVPLQQVRTIAVSEDDHNSSSRPQSLRWEFINSVVNFSLFKKILYFSWKRFNDSSSNIRKNLYFKK